MRKTLLTIAAALVAGLASPVLAQDTFEDRPDVTPVETSDPEMNKAIATAQRTLPEFLEVLENPPPGLLHLSFKFPLGGWEHIWVDQVQRKGDVLIGRLSNVPMQEEWRQGQRVSVPLSEVSDWSWMGSDGVMRGQFTTRVLLDRIDPAQAEAIRRDFGWER